MWVTTRAGGLRGALGRDAPQLAAPRGGRRGERGAIAGWTWYFGAYRSFKDDKDEEEELELEELQDFKLSSSGETSGQWIM
jgi:hypothetical protein